MQVKLEKTFPIGASPEAAWRVLSDIKGVAECMPGAAITEQEDDSHYKGQVRVKLGPATATFKGDIEVKSIDPEARQIAMLGKGSDVKGSSAASMDLVAYIREAGDSQCELVGTSEVTISGKMANFGGRMMTQVSDQILKQFGENFTNRVMESSNGETAGPQEGQNGAAQRPQELNGLALAWNVLVGFVKGLFEKKSDRGRT